MGNITVSKGKSKKEKEIIEMAAEQFARLFWKQWIYMKEKEKYKLRSTNFSRRKDIES